MLAALPIFSTKGPWKIKIKMALTIAMFICYWIFCFYFKTFFDLNYAFVVLLINESFLWVDIILFCFYISNSLTGNLMRYVAWRSEIFFFHIPLSFKVKVPYPYMDRCIFFQQCVILAISLRLHGLKQYIFCVKSQEYYGM